MSKETVKNTAVTEVKPVDQVALTAFEIQKQKDKESVRGKFIFHEIAGGQLDFVFKKYKGDQIQKYSLKDGQVYTVPRAVARHLNTNCSYPSYNYKSDENGRPQVSISEKVRRCSFQSLEFLDQVDQSANGYDLSALPRA